MKTLYTLLSLFILLACTLAVHAQTDTTDNSGFKIGLSYKTNSIYMGRQDTVTIPALTPQISYTFKNGLYLSALLDYLPNRSTNKVDETSIEFGYNFKLGKNGGGSTSLNKMFYNSNSTQVDATISTEFNASAYYNLGNIITPELGFTYGFASGSYTNDVLFSPGISHDFEIDGILSSKDALTISPEAILNWGTQNFYDGYLNRLTIKNKKLGKLATAEQTAYNQNLKDYQSFLNQLNVLDYEFSLPIVYQTGMVSITATPTLFLPQNGLPTPTNTYQKLIQHGIPALSGSLMVFELGVNIKF